MLTVDYRVKLLITIMFSTLVIIFDLLQEPKRYLEKTKLWCKCEINTICASEQCLYPSLKDITEIYCSERLTKSSTRVHIRGKKRFFF